MPCCPPHPHLLPAPPPHLLSPLHPKNSTNQCLQVGRWMGRTGGVLCNVNQAFQVAVYTSLKDSSTLGALSSDLKEEVCRMSEGELKWHSDLFELIKEHFSYVYGLFTNPKKVSELTEHTQYIQTMVQRTRSNDYNGWKAVIGQYAAEDLEYPLLPFINDKTPRERMGFNHRQLARLLVPAKYITLYKENPAKHCKAMAEAQGDIPVNASGIPAFMYKGKPPGASYDQKNVIGGFGLGFIVTRFLKHLLIGPSATLKSKPVPPDVCSNCALMVTHKVMPEHLSYVMLGIHSAMSSVSRWPAQDGDYNWELMHRKLLEFL
ncbi:hypothetical protein CONPUDRAFT_77055 [Coniophora puteana RWD-64-598 SS2]|uniref:Uncharacterized protein n=1 Tax=Coniophora puteana (strain RWD-64-598) TaxID=741705 RepID=A0A5M3M9S8_CONPW|nr:uncharacterized protein CONPUDRAFT_77055 [Coniophora puteana RWD-64-598 SS2]EIW76042.1 hypothetical protein CONPUDRAFT_77055 [Coniophora puteana RWD-64-598 SS2]